MHKQQINGQLVTWELVDRGHWRWAQWDIVRYVKGQRSVGQEVDWHPRQRRGDYRALRIEWRILERGKARPKGCRSLEHAQRVVREIEESRT